MATKRFYWPWHNSRKHIHPFHNQQRANLTGCCGNVRHFMVADKSQSIGTIAVCIDVYYQRGRHCQHGAKNTRQDVGSNLNAIKQKVHHCRIRREHTRSSTHQPQIWLAQGIKGCNQGTCIWHAHAHKILITLRESISTIRMRRWNTRKISIGNILT